MHIRYDLRAETKARSAIKADLNLKL